ncbi:hypothetical protein ACTA71_011847 [Dictyostelium dimigraforme]
MFNDFQRLEISYTNFEYGYTFNLTIIYPPCKSFYDAGERIRQIKKSLNDTTSFYTLEIEISKGYYYLEQFGFGNIFGFNIININNNSDGDIIIGGLNLKTTFIELSDQLNSNNILQVNFLNSFKQLNIGFLNSKFINIIDSNILMALNIGSLYIGSCDFFDIHFATMNYKTSYWKIIGENAPINLINSNIDWHGSNIFNSSSTTPFIYYKFYGGLFENVSTTNGIISLENIMSTGIYNLTFINNNNTLGSIFEYQTDQTIIDGNFIITDCTFESNENRLSSLLSIESTFKTFEKRDEVLNCTFNGNIIPKQRSAVILKESNSVFLSKDPIIGKNSSLLYNSDQFNINSTLSTCTGRNIKFCYGSDGINSNSMSNNRLTGSEVENNKRKLTPPFIALIVIVSLILISIPAFLIIQYFRKRKDRKLFNSNDDDYMYINSNINHESEPLIK